jgi:hypothetical protein
MKPKILFALTIYVLLPSLSIFGQSKTFVDTVSIYFDEIKESAKNHTDIWNKNLYAPILLVNPFTQQLFANEPDSAGVLQQEDAIYTGMLPHDLSIANTSISWNGKTWAMIVTAAIPPDKENRINLFAHELFHVSQPSLEFTIANVDNNHLDQKEGRIYLRLELEALKEALQALSKKEMLEHLTNACVFRKYRNSLYANSDTTENSLELLEGLAEYTGVMHVDWNDEQLKEHLAHRINNFSQMPTFVRSFAYQTTPAYGYLLYQTKKDWNKEISTTTLLTNYFINAFEIKLPDDLEKSVTENAEKYNGKIIFTEETARDEQTKKLIAEYKTRFVEQPHFDIYFEQMNISFDPRNIMPLEDKGSVYPNVRIIDDWGILTAENGALLAPNWDKVSLSLPVSEEGNTIFGDGWTLELSGEYSITIDNTNGNYALKKK